MLKQIRIIDNKKENIQVDEGEEKVKEKENRKKKEKARK